MSLSYIPSMYSREELLSICKKFESLLAVTDPKGSKTFQYTYTILEKLPVYCFTEKFETFIAANIKEIEAKLYIRNTCYAIETDKDIIKQSDCDEYAHELIENFTIIVDSIRELKVQFPVEVDISTGDVKLIKELNLPYIPECMPNREEALLIISAGMFELRGLNEHDDAITMRQTYTSIKNIDADDEFFKESFCIFECENAYEFDLKMFTRTLAYEQAYKDGLINNDKMVARYCTIIFNITNSFSDTIDLDAERYAINIDTREYKILK